jgi:AraC-like DNA-binding protein
MALKEIALLSGFADQSYLNQAFCRHMNITQAEYRKHAYSSRLRAGESAQGDLFANYASWLAGGELVKIMGATIQVAG